MPKSDKVLNVMPDIHLALSALKQNTLLRQRHIVCGRQQQLINIDGRQLINFAGNDYLALTQDARVKQSFASAAEQYGLGSGASAMVSGFSNPHHELELAAAEYLKRPRAILFNSGYHANIGVITALADRDSTIIADKHCHASTIDGIQLSRAHLYRYRHHDLQHADALLQQHQSANTLLVTESVFSMSGEVSDLLQAAQLAKKHQAQLIIDDAHGFGVRQQHLPSDKFPVLITPLGKALGSMGAVVSGETDLIELILQKARTYCYSTALPPAVCSASVAALRILTEEPWRTQKLIDLCQYFVEQCRLRNLPLIAEDHTPIKCILTRDNDKTLLLQKKLLQCGFYTGAIRPPTVAANAARIRVTITVAHTKEDIQQLLDCLAENVDAE